MIKDGFAQKCSCNTINLRVVCVCMWARVRMCMFSKGCKLLYMFPDRHSCLHLLTLRCTFAVC